jgi:hypothetical protein
MEADDALLMILFLPIASALGLFASLSFEPLALFQSVAGLELT